MLLAHTHAAVSLRSEGQAANEQSWAEVLWYIRVLCRGRLGAHDELNRRIVESGSSSGREQDLLGREVQQHELLGRWRDMRNSG